MLWSQFPPRLAAQSVRQVGLEAVLQRSLRDIPRQSLEHSQPPKCWQATPARLSLAARAFCSGSAPGEAPPQRVLRGGRRSSGSGRLPQTLHANLWRRPRDDDVAINKDFDSLPLSKGTLQALREKFGFEAMSEVQQQVLPTALSSTRDLVVRAHTGTGKTLAYLIPALEAVLAAPASERGVSALVVTPTRELSLQVANEAEMLFSSYKIGIVTLIGGSSQRQDQVTLRRKKPRLIVGTPGRLLEHFERTYLFPSLFEQLHILVLDEADRLLSMGFLEDVKEIIAYLPVRRRSLLFSATIPQQVLDIAARACRGNYDFIDCIGEEASPTASMVDQSYAVFPGHQLMTALYNLLMTEIARDKYTYKVLVFFPTARMTTFMAQFFRQQLRFAVYEIHRRRDAEARQVTQDRFKGERSGVLFSSDVSARGMDYPGVTLVVQFGAPATRELYIHRVGRTARAGREGRAVLLLGQLEQGFLRAVEDLPVEPMDTADSLQRSNELLVKATTSWVASAPLRSAATAAFASLLVHYKATHRILCMMDDDAIQAAGDILLGCGLVDQPVVPKRLAVMLGLENNPLIQIASPLGEQELWEQTEVSGRKPWRG